MEEQDEEEEKFRYANWDFLLIVVQIAFGLNSIDDNGKTWKFKHKQNHFFPSKFNRIVVCVRCACVCVCNTYTV